MAAPSGTVWGSIVGSYGKIGIYKSVSSTNTTTTATVEVWFWSKYSVSDTANTLYYDNLSASGSATTSRGSINISTTNDSGSGWNTANQKKLASYSYSYTRGTSASTRYLYAKLANVDRVGGTMTVSTTFSVPKLASYTVSYNANGGSGAPAAQTKWYGKTLTLSSTKPTRSGYSFVGWGTSISDTSADYAAGGNYTANAGDTLYAIWKKTITLTYNNNGGSGAPSAQSATVYNATTSYKFTLSSTKPTRSGYAFLGWSTSSGASSASYSAGGTVTLSSNTTLYAVWKINTYTVSYNANGGSGAPSNQTKTHGQTLTLSSTKPTRTGYSFQGWATSSTGSVAYVAGASYTANSAATLYAVWKINTYTVSYNANGGTGAPAAQTKTYGQTLTLSSTKPTRTNYTFQGWATSSTGAVSYASGGSYTTNSAITLYAVWKLAYTKPVISNVSVKRCDAFGTISDEGTNAQITFAWSTFYNVSSIVIKIETSTETISKPVSASGTSGTATVIVGNDKLNAEAMYPVIISVTDSGGTTHKTVSVPGLIFVMDMKAGGKGVSFGKVADMDGYADFAFATRHRKDMHFDNQKVIYGKEPDGSETIVIVPKTDSGDTYIGYGNYKNKSGDTGIFGNDIYFFVGSTDIQGVLPYYRAGTYVEISIETSGFVTSGGKEVYFTVPLSKPIYGNPTVDVANRHGFMLRQGGQYTHGSNINPATYALTTSLTAVRVHANMGVVVKATFDDTTNVINNDSIGIAWSGTITFS